MKKSVKPKQFLWKIKPDIANSFSYKCPDQIVYSSDAIQAAEIFLKFIFPHSGYNPVFRFGSSEFTVDESFSGRKPSWHLLVVSDNYEKELLLKYKTVLNEKEYPI